MGGSIDAVHDAERAFFASDLPTIRDVVQGFDVRRWAVMAPAGTPQAIVDKLSPRSSPFSSLRQSGTAAMLRDRGVVRIGNSAKEVANVMANGYEHSRKIAEEAGI